MKSLFSILSDGVNQRDIIARNEMFHDGDRSQKYLEIFVPNNVYDKTQKQRDRNKFYGYIWKHYFF
jgi:hypothetical protein